MSHHQVSNNFAEKIKSRLQFIYGDDLKPEYTQRLIDLVSRHATNGEQNPEKWNEKDIVLITYGDSVKNKNESGLPVLHRFLNRHLKSELTFVHILPFFPYSSDDGFSVIDFKVVNPDLGDWEDVRNLKNDYKLMFDLVINHISKESRWFQNFLQGKSPGKDYFITVDPDTDMSKVVRPRSLPLLTPFETSEGTKHVWTTFSDDQIDLNFSNPEVLYQMVDILLHYMKNGASMIRMDAIAFLWKEIGTTCLHLPQTHEIVKLFRDIMEQVDPQSILITETNVPNKENLSYFGNGDEAHQVYQFPLPPLLLHALYSGNAAHLSEWVAGIPEIPDGCTFFNFTASHDGIGVRPLEGLLPDDELTQLLDGMKASGAKISTRRKSDGSDSPYEINIAWWDAMSRTISGTDRLHFDRFIASQIIMMQMKGVPAFYIHNLLATENYDEGVEQTGRARTINRRKWEESEIETLLAEDNHHHAVLNELKRLINIRKEQHAFHPDSAQEVIDLDTGIFAVRRTSPDKKHHITCITNITRQSAEVNLDAYGVKLPAHDLIGGTNIGPAKKLFLSAYKTLWVVE
jgi:sucrose phosphorylase